MRAGRAVSGALVRTGANRGHQPATTPALPQGAPHRARLNPTRRNRSPFTRRYEACSLTLAAASSAVPPRPPPRRLQTPSGAPEMAPPPEVPAFSGNAITRKRSGTGSSRSANLTANVDSEADRADQHWRAQLVQLQTSIPSRLPPPSHAGPYVRRDRSRTWSCWDRTNGGHRRTPDQGLDLGVHGYQGPTADRAVPQRSQKHEERTCPLPPPGPVKARLPTLGSAPPRSRRRRRRLAGELGQRMVTLRWSERETVTDRSQGAQPERLQKLVRYVRGDRLW